MNSYIRNAAKSLYSIKAIFDSRKSPMWFALLFFLLLNVGFAFPFTYSFTKLEQINAASFLSEEEISALENTGELDFLKSASIVDGKLIGIESGIKSIKIVKYEVVIDMDDEYTQSQEPFARLTSEYMMLNPGIKLYSNYEGFEVLDLSSASSKQALDYFLKQGLKGSISQWIIPLSVFFFIAFLMVNVLFVFGMSLLALLFRFGDKVRVTYPEILKMVIFSTTLPAVISILVTMPTSLLGLNLMIYDFGTIIMYMILRRNHLKKGETVTSNKR